MPNFTDWFKSWSEMSCLVGNSQGEVATIDCVSVVFYNLVSALILFVGLTAVVMFIFAGYKVVNSAGDPKKLESARQSFGYGLLGLSVVLLAFAIISIVSIVSGVPCINSFSFDCVLPPK